MRSSLACEPAGIISRELGTAVCSMVTAERTTTPVAAYELARSYSTITRSCRRLLRQYLYYCSSEASKARHIRVREVALDDHYHYHSTLVAHQHTSAYVSIRQHTSAYVSIRACICQHTSAYVSIRQHTSAEHHAVLQERVASVIVLLY